MKTTQPLVLITASFPYGTKSETFLETEIVYLAKQFDSVIIIPAVPDGTFIRELPSNVTVSRILMDRKKRKGKKIFFNHWFRFWRVFLFTAFHSSSNFKTYHLNFKYYVSRLLGELEYYEVLKPFIHYKNLKHAVFYTYWFDYASTALAILKKEQVISKVVSRAHGFDLYDERNKQQLPMAFRDFKVAHTSGIYCISQHGKDYLKSKVKARYHANIHLSYLGILKNEQTFSTSNYTIPKIISVASIIPLKRTIMIVNALKHYPSPLQWIHFGNGSEYEKIKGLCQELPEHIQWELKGHVSNPELVAFYKTTKVDLFISTSESEGLPVSMMEAIGFGVPILACATGGIPEIVIPKKTGALMQIDVTPEEISKAIETALNAGYQPEEIRNYFLEHFDAEKNYVAFSTELSNIA